MIEQMRVFNKVGMTEKSRIYREFYVYSGYEFYEDDYEDFNQMPLAFF